MAFIVAEGIDGAGKSTALRAAAARARALGREVVELRESGSTPLGERLRALILDPGLGEIAGWSEACLFTAARVELVRSSIRPALLAGAVVLLDRYYYSTIAYQGFGGGLDPRAIEDLNRKALDGLEPGRVLLFDLDRSRNWRVSIDGGPAAPLKVSSQGVATVAAQGMGAHSVNVLSN